MFEVNTLIKKDIMKKTNFYTIFYKDMSDAFVTHYLSIKNIYGNEFNYHLSTDKDTILKYGKFIKENNINAKIINQEVNDHIFKKLDGRISEQSSFVMLNLFEIFPEIDSKENNLYIGPKKIVNKKISEEYFDSNENIAFTKNNFKDYANFLKKTEFWNSNLEEHPFEKLKVMNLIFKKKYFDADIIVINDSKKLSRLFKRAISLDVVFDVQTLINICNDKEIVSVEDLNQSIKLKVADKNEKNNFNKLDDKKNITLLVTLYNPTKNELKYWTKLYNRVNESHKNIVIQMLVDGTSVNLEKVKDKTNIFKFKKNQGKFLMVYNHIKSGKVTTPYFKVCDPDDLISIDKLSGIELPKDNDSIILTAQTKFRHKPLFKTEKLIASALEKTKKHIHSSFGNSWTILPTEKIKNDKYYSGNKFMYHDDQILGYLAFANGGKIVEMRDKWFYYYQTSVGHTSYHNFHKMMTNLKPTFEELIHIKNEANFTNPLTWPNNYSYYFILRKKFITKSKNANNETIEEVDKKLADIIELGFK